LETTQNPKGGPWEPEIVQRYYERVWRDGDVDPIDELLTPDHVDETPPPGFRRHP
jgi:hypothetical protein